MIKLSRWFALGAVYAVLSVVAGSLAAHALKPLLNDNDGMTVFMLARDYLGYHGLVLMVIAMAIERWPSMALHRPTRLIASGAALFSGALFALALTAWKPVAHLAPVGGGLMIIGWLWLTYLSIRAAK